MKADWPALTGLVVFDCPPDQQEHFDRFLSKCILAPSLCWIWQGELVGKGYGRFAFDNRRMVAHRWIYQLTVNEIPDEIQVDHLCLVHPGVNPCHLEAVTGGENMRRRSALITECPWGHPYDEANTRVYQGRRYCRACTNGGWRKRQRAALPGAA